VIGTGGKGDSITRVDRATGKVQHLSQAQVKDLLDAGRSAELRGSLEPDIVIHSGNPLHVQADPYAESTQKDVYMKVLNRNVFRVLPHWGVLP
jgi:hypothetical protein